MNRKNIFLWTLYDFANSIAIVVFFLYFSQWLVVEHGVSDLWYNLIFTGASILLFATAPVLGRTSDAMHTRMPFLRAATALLFLSLLAVSLITNFSPKAVLAAALFYLVGNYFYQLSFCFYNPLLHDLAPMRLWGRISGRGQFANMLGQIAGLGIALPLAGNAVLLFGAPGRAQTFLPATLLFFALALPMLLFFKEPTARRPIKFRLIEEYKTFFRSFKELLRSPGMGRFLLGYFLFNDAVLTASNNFPIFLNQVFHASDRTQSLLLGGILATSAIGALAAGWLSDKIGLKKSLIFILLGWVVVFPAIGLIKSFPIFVGATVAMGLLYGAIWTVTRAVMSYLSPPAQLNHAFSYYTLAERFATFVGPVTWGLITHFLIDLGSVRYRIAAIAMGAFVVAGLLIVRKIPSESRIVKQEVL